LTPLTEQQVESVLTDQFPKLRIIALAIIGKSKVSAEEVVSDCIASALSQLRAGKVRFENPARCCAWIRQIVRLNARRRAGRRRGDITPILGRVAISLNQLEEKGFTLAQGDDHPRYGTAISKFAER